MTEQSKLTTAVHKGIVADIKDGMYIIEAVARAGIASKTFYRWLTKGMADIEAGEATPHAKFCAAVKVAQVHVEHECLGVLKKLLESDDDKVKFSTATWMLERKFPARWAKRTFTADMTPEDLAKIGDDELKRLMEETFGRPVPGGNDDG